jgi:UDP-GlcNAc3NAcA epimerase
MEIAEQEHSLGKFNLTSGQYILSTIHRAENTDNRDRLEAILEAFKALDEKVVLPLHPRTKSKIEVFGLNSILENAPKIEIIEPLSYLEMLLLEKHAKVIVTDSGGVQKEAYFAKVPCVTLRDQTEWTETIEAGWNQLVNPLTDNLPEILANVESGKPIENLYGDGEAAKKIIAIMKSHL